MKKLFFILTIAFLLFSNYEQANAQCPPTYTPDTQYITVNGCVYEVELCIKCSPLGQLPESVSVIGFTKIPTSPACVQYWSATQVLQYIELTVSNPIFYYTYLCTNANGAPPCPDQSDEIEIKHYNCWQIQLIDYYGDEALHFTICDEDVYCYEVITWCYDASIPEYNRTVTDGPTQVGTPDCTTKAADVDIPTELWEYSDCFMFPTPCD